MQISYFINHYLKVRHIYIPGKNLLVERPSIDGRQIALHDCDLEASKLAKLPRGVEYDNY
jgi:hypothetical protein